MAAKEKLKALLNHNVVVITSLRENSAHRNEISADLCDGERQ